MNYKIRLTSILLFSLMMLNHLKSQVLQIKETQTPDFYCPTVAKDTINTLFVHGRVVKKENPKVGMARAVIQIKGNDTYTASDSLGYYWLDVSAIASAKNFTIQCSFVNHATKEVAIKHKLNKTTIINFELELSGGIVGPGQVIKKPVKKKQKTSKK